MKDHILPSSLRLLLPLPPLLAASDPHQPTPRDLIRAGRDRPSDQSSRRRECLLGKRKMNGKRSFAHIAEKKRDNKGRRKGRGEDIGWQVSRQ
ncbi:hypothetical protein BO71DRAFT_39710 [Aspergillus ellipticus CBS 707.79]|uniref:Secreted protein n=1 Tax=Aspergillus ellipticus CBS 707.79 TaxID=1448320 RepID=A0A319D2M2_9EURO|nr:hypothetical protein BO71DRAFT_39710 [Aspergillus ellipticus CBS 707.79]